MSHKTLSVLIVDDDAVKARNIAKGILETNLYSQDAIEIVTTANDAKRRLKLAQFDLLVLDIALPLRAGEDPEQFGGLELLTEILERDSFSRPRHVVGVTSYEDTYYAALDRFGAELWSVVQYSTTSDSWLEMLKNKARHIWASENAAQGKQTYQTDLLVITALQDPELDSVLGLPWSWKLHPVQDDPTVYHKGQFARKNGSSGSVIAARAALMGMPAAAILATKAIMQFRPKIIVMTGICAGDSDSVNLGDVIAASPCWDYGNGKHSVTEEGKKVFTHSPYPEKLATRIRSSLERAKLDVEGLAQIRNQFPSSKPGTVLDLHIGPLASGAAVLADKDLFNEVKNLQHRKLLGVDMEAYAVMAAAAEVPGPLPEALVIKGVSDFADKDKGDAVRHYASFVSARVMARLITEFDL